MPIFDFLGQLGHGSKENETSPKLVSFFEGKKIRTLSLGGFHTLACTEDGNIYACGGGQYGLLPAFLFSFQTGIIFPLKGQLGLAELKEAELVPVLVPKSESVHFCQLAAGWWHSMALTGDALQPASFSSSSSEEMHEQESVRQINEEISDLQKEMESSERAQISSENSPETPEKLKTSSELILVPKEESIRSPAKDLRIESVKQNSTPKSPLQKLASFFTFSFSATESGSASSDDISVRRQQFDEEKAESYWNSYVLQNWETLHKKEKLYDMVSKGIPIGVRGKVNTQKEITFFFLDIISKF